jgi:hypothetical protein
MLLLPLLASSSSSIAYDYPIDNPFAATIIGTPKADMAILPKDIRRKEMNVIIHGDRTIPNFFPGRSFRYSLAYQKQKAPLIFVIAGTGASHHSGKMTILEKAFYQAGFHVVSLSSPTYANFILTASTTQVPGNIEDDSRDLYSVMEHIWDDIQSKVKVSEFFVTGYSLGGAQAAYVTKLDETKGSFNFKKALMINPPVSLFNSLGILDKMLENNSLGGHKSFNDFFDDIMKRFTDVYTQQEKIDFNDEFLYRIFEGKDQQVDPERIAAIIGLSFRISSANMIFVSDIATNAGYLLPKNHILHKRESTTNYYKVAVRISFTDYFNERFYDYFIQIHPGLSKEKLVQQSSLRNIKDYLRNSKKIGVMHNVDDIILAPGEIDFFRNTFGNRAMIYPKGGHCGNIGYKENIDFMLAYFNE